MKVFVHSPWWKKQNIYTWSNASIRTGLGSLFYENERDYANGSASVHISQLQIQLPDYAKFLFYENIFQP